MQTRRMNAKLNRRRREPPRPAVYHKDQSGLADGLSLFPQVRQVISVADVRRRKVVQVGHESPGIDQRPDPLDLPVQ